MLNEKARQAIFASFLGILAFIILTQSGAAVGRVVGENLYPTDLEMQDALAGVGHLTGFFGFLALVVFTMLRNGGR